MEGSGKRQRATTSNRFLPRLPCPPHPRARSRSAFPTCPKCSQWSQDPCVRWTVGRQASAAKAVPAKVSAAQAAPADRQGFGLEGVRYRPQAARGARPNRFQGFPGRIGPPASEVRARKGRELAASGPQGSRAYSIRRASVGVVRQWFDDVARRGAASGGRVAVDVACHSRKGTASNAPRITTRSPADQPTSYPAFAVST